jgi:hypothetical protein
MDPASRFYAAQQQQAEYEAWYQWWQESQAAQYQYPVDPRQYAQSAPTQLRYAPTTGTLPRRPLPRASALSQSKSDLARPSTIASACGVWL